MSDWINVKDELPHKKGRYIVYAPTYKGGTAHELGKKGILFAKWNKHWSLEVGRYKKLNCVEFWMPIPEIPNNN